jgi:Zn-dependent peptidase ImmA (M78 family)
VAAVDLELRAARGAVTRFAELYGAEPDERMPVEDIADSLFGLRVVTVTGLGASGMLLPARREVLIDAGEGPLRRRFTIAHEVGHFVLHAARADAAAVFCRTVEVQERVERTVDPLEREANRFAAELLMPEEAVRASALRDGPDAAALAGRFGVSGLAMGWRLYNLGLVTTRPV